MPKKIKPNGKVKKVEYTTSTDTILDASLWDQVDFLITKKAKEITKPKKSPQERLKILKNNANNLIKIGKKKKLYPPEVIDKMELDFIAQDYQSVIDLSFACDYINRSASKDKIGMMRGVCQVHQNTRKRKIPVSRFTGIQIPTEDL